MKYIVNLDDLECEDIYIDINKESKEILKGKIKNGFKTYKTFSKYLNLKTDRLYRNNDLLHFFGGHKIKLSFLKKIISPFPELNDDFIEKNIYRIGCRRWNLDIYYPKLPFNFNTKEGIKFISAILHDGGISSSLKPNYRNNDTQLRKSIINCAKKIFGDFKVSESGTFVSFPKTMGIILKKIGLKEGKKVINNPAIPEFILKSDLECKRIFLRQAFDDEGCVPKINDKHINIGLHVDVTKEKRIPNLIKGIKILLEDIGIRVNEPSLSKEYKAGDNLRQRWIINICGRKNLEIFYNDIGFDIKKKEERLKKILESYKTNKYKSLKNERYNEALINLYKTIDYKEFTIKQASEIINLYYDYTKILIWKMEKEGYIKRLNDKEYPKKFKFTEKSLSSLS